MRIKRFACVVMVLVCGCSSFPPCTSGDSHEWDKWEVKEGWQSVDLTGQHEIQHRHCKKCGIEERH